VRLVGRADGLAGRRLALRTDLGAQIDAARRRRERVLSRIDAHIAATATAAPADPAAWAHATLPDAAPPSLDLAAEGIETVVWATGYRRDYGWLRLPVLDAAGELAHDGGITPWPGLYALGLRFLRRRRSTYIGGVGGDAEAIAGAVARHLAVTRPLAA
jgi:putative flavoprotein involved in K+ transport